MSIVLMNIVNYYRSKIGYLVSVLLFVIHQFECLCTFAVEQQGVCMTLSNIELPDSNST